MSEEDHFETKNNTDSCEWKEKKKKISETKSISIRNCKNIKQVIKSNRNQKYRMYTHSISIICLPHKSYLINLARRLLTIHFPTRKKTTVLMMNAVKQ